MKPLFSLLQHSLWFIVRCLLLLVLVCPLHAGIDSAAGATSKPAGQARIVAQQNGLASHHLSPAASDHEGERDDDPPPAKRAQSDPAAPIACSRCHKTLNEQALTRVLRGSTAESVACDACLYPASQTLPQETTGKRKTTRKRTRPDPAAPQAKRSKSQAGKRKQTGNPQNEPAAKRAKLDTRESTTGTVVALDILKQHLAFEMDEQETEAAKQLFERLKNKKLKVKKSLWELLSKVDRKDFPAFCDKASVFFGALTSTITDTGCLTSMLNCRKKYIRDFAGRENPELEYLAGLDTLRTFSSMNHCNGLPQQADVEDVMRWKVWEVDGKFSMELLRAFSSMNHGKGLPKQADVKDVKRWKVWEVDGRFSMELFRAFSSMNRGKGLPKQADVEDVMRWKVWEVDGQFSMELLRAFSSMNNGKGLLKQTDVEDVMRWKAWEVDGQFNMELFRAFSSMNSGKGLPKQADVEEVKRWKVWEVDGKFSMELFRAFSSMNSSRGLPKQADVEDLKRWKAWEVDGQFNMELLRAFSSMSSSRGLPEQADVEDLKRWKVWEVDGKFNMELFRAFSSMNSSRGLPKQADVEEVKRWKVWEVDGKFSMELFRAFSSMNNGKGLPKEAGVEDVKRWKVWEVDGKFSMELLRAFSSMNNGKGLPKQADVEDVKRWKVWEVDGKFSMELFRAFSSMPLFMELFRAFSSNGSRGLPKQADVEDVMRWKVWEVDGKFNMELFRAFELELFRAFSSMNSGKGLPKQADVEDVKRWKVWEVDGQFSLERLRAFSSMSCKRCLPKRADVEAVLAWLNCGETLNDVLQNLMVRLYVSEGIPDTRKLKQYEQKLSELFFANASIEPESDDEKEQSCLIKQVALFLLTRKPQYFLNLGDVEYFYQQVTGDADRRLEKLLRLLTSYGCAGVTRYLALNNNDRNALLSTCASRIPLPLAMKAINEFSPHERKRYLSFSRNLKAPPDKTQWNHIRLQLKRLTSALKTPHAKRRYLEVVWNLSPSVRDIFLDETRVATVTAVFPSLNALKNLANRHSRQWLKELLEACLQYRQGTPSKENIKCLFTALLETQLPLYDHNDIPDYFLSGYMALGDSALFIRVTPPIQTAEELALHFVAAVMGVLSDMFYHYAANQLKVQQYGGEIHTFPVPELEIHDDGIAISHWSAEVFSRFLAITEFPEHYYFSQEAWQRHYPPGLPGYIQPGMATCHQRESTAPDAITFHPLSIPALMGLLKHNIRISPSAWKSFDHHKDRLPGAAHNRLLSEIEKAAHEDIPVSLKEYLEARRPPEEALPQNEMNAPASPPPAIAVDIAVDIAVELLSEEEQFQRLWTDLSGKTLVVVADMELLAGYKDYMTMEHIVSILKRADVGMELYRVDELRRLLGEKKDRYLRHDPLLLNLPDEVANYLIEADI